MPGITSSLAGVTDKDLDWVIVRENSEDEYSGQGGFSHRGQPHEVATDMAVFTRTGVDSIIRLAFESAQ